MTTSTLSPTKPPCTHREQLPARDCMRCGAYLRSYANEAFCDPCSKPTVDVNDVDAVVERIASIKDPRKRRQAFEALADMTQEAAIWEMTPA